MMPTCPLFHKTQSLRRTKSNEQGFTLIELLVVLAIMSLAAVLFVGATGSSGQNPRGDLANLERTITNARQQAIVSNKPQQVALVDYELSLRPQVGRQSAAITFYPDGSSNGGSIYRGDKEIFMVRWIDGRIAR